MKHNEWLGKTVTYISNSGRHYDATIFHLPSCCIPEGTDKPVVSLGFRDKKGQLTRLDHVLHYEGTQTGVRCWKEKEVNG